MRSISPTGPAAALHSPGGPDSTPAQHQTWGALSACKANLSSTAPPSHNFLSRHRLAQTLKTLAGERVPKQPFVALGPGSPLPSPTPRTRQKPGGAGRGLGFAPARPAGGASARPRPPRCPREPSAWLASSAGARRSRWSPAARTAVGIHEPPAGAGAGASGARRGPRGGSRGGWLLPRPGGDARAAPASRPWSTPPSVGPPGCRARGARSGRCRRAGRGSGFGARRGSPGRRVPPASLLAALTCAVGPVAFKAGTPCRRRGDGAGREHALQVRKEESFL